MSYLLQTKRPNKGFKRFFIFFLIIVLIGGALFSPLSQLFRYVATITHTDKLRDSVVDWFRFKHAIINENEKLLKEITELNAMVADRDILAFQNIELKNLQTSSKLAPKVATVLLRPGFSAFDNFVISLGSNDGVELGDLALYHSIILGEVSEINKTTSNVTLFSTSGKTFPVRVGKSGIESEAKGLGGGSFELMLPKNVDVEAGETVYLASNAPRVFGKVVSTESDEGDTFKRVLFSLPININLIDFLTIEKKEL